jgi:hypothetical protein
MIIGYLRPEYSISQRCSVTQYLVNVALAIDPNNASDLAKPSVILSGGLHLGVRAEIPESNTVRSFVVISDYGVNEC